MRKLWVLAALVTCPALAQTKPAAAPAPADYGATITYAEGVRIGEEYMRRNLADPQSAQFTWPYDFIPFTEKIRGYGHATGYATCFTMNAKNRYGGYVGPRQSRIVIRDGKVVDKMDVPELKFVPDPCEELVKGLNLPPAPTKPAS